MDWLKSKFKRIIGSGNDPAERLNKTFSPKKSRYKDFSERSLIKERNVTERFGTPYDKPARKSTTALNKSHVETGKRSDLHRFESYDSQRPRRYGDVVDRDPKHDSELSQQNKKLFELKEPTNNNNRFLIQDLLKSKEIDNSLLNVNLELFPGSQTNGCKQDAGMGRSVSKFSGDNPGIEKEKDTALLRKSDDSQPFPADHQSSQKDSDMSKLFYNDPVQQGYKALALKRSQPVDSKLTARQGDRLFNDAENGQKSYDHSSHNTFNYHPNANVPENGQRSYNPSSHNTFNYHPNANLPENGQTNYVPSSHNTQKYHPNVSVPENGQTNYVPSSHNTQKYHPNVSVPENGRKSFNHSSHNTFNYHPNANLRENGQKSYNPSSHNTFNYHPNVSVPENGQRSYNPSCQPRAYQPFGNVPEVDFQRHIVSFDDCPDDNGRSNVISYIKGTPSANFSYLEEKNYVVEGDIPQKTAIFKESDNSHKSDLSELSRMGKRDIKICKSTEDMELLNSDDSDETSPAVDNLSFFSGRKRPVDDLKKSHNSEKLFAQSLEAPLINREDLQRCINNPRNLISTPGPKGEVDNIANKSSVHQSTLTHNSDLKKTQNDKLFVSTSEADHKTSTRESMFQLDPKLSEQINHVLARYCNRNKQLSTFEVPVSSDVSILDKSGSDEADSSVLVNTTSNASKNTVPKRNQKRAGKSIKSAVKKVASVQSSDWEKRLEQSYLPKDDLKSHLSFFKIRKTIDKKRELGKRYRPEKDFYKGDSVAEEIKNLFCKTAEVYDKKYSLSQSKSADSTKQDNEGRRLCLVKEKPLTAVDVDKNNTKMDSNKEHDFPNVEPCSIEASSVTEFDDLPFSEDNTNIQIDEAAKSYLSCIKQIVNDCDAHLSSVGVTYNPFSFYFGNPMYFGKDAKPTNLQEVETSMKDACEYAIQSSEILKNENNLPIVSHTESEHHRKRVITSDTCSRCQNVKSTANDKIAKANKDGGSRKRKAPSLNKLDPTIMYYIKSFARLHCARNKGYYKGSKVNCTETNEYSNDERLLNITKTASGSFFDSTYEKLSQGINERPNVCVNEDKDTENSISDDLHSHYSAEEDTTVLHRQDNDDNVRGSSSSASSGGDLKSGDISDNHIKGRGTTTFTADVGKYLNLSSDLPLKHDLLKFDDIMSAFKESDRNTKDTANDPPGNTEYSNTTNEDYFNKKIFTDVKPGMDGNKIQNFRREDTLRNESGKLSSINEDGGTSESHTGTEISAKSHSWSREEILRRGMGKTMVTTSEPQQSKPTTSKADSSDDDCMIVDVEPSGSQYPQRTVSGHLPGLSTFAKADKYSFMPTSKFYDHGRHSKAFTSDSTQLPPRMGGHSENISSDDEASYESSEYDASNGSTTSFKSGSSDDGTESVQENPMDEELKGKSVDCLEQLSSDSTESDHSDEYSCAINEDKCDNTDSSIATNDLSSLDEQSEDPSSEKDVEPCGYTETKLKSSEEALNPFNVLKSFDGDHETLSRDNIKEDKSAGFLNQFSQSTRSNIEVSALDKKPTTENLELSRSGLPYTENVAFHPVNPLGVQDSNMTGDEKLAHFGTEGGQTGCFLNPPIVETTCINTEDESFPRGSYVDGKKDAAELASPFSKQMCPNLQAQTSEDAKEKIFPTGNFTAIDAGFVSLPNTFNKKSIDDSNNGEATFVSAAGDKDSATNLLSPFGKQAFDGSNNVKLNFDVTAADKASSTNLLSPFGKQAFDVSNNVKLNFDVTAADKASSTNLLDPFSKQAFDGSDVGKLSRGGAAGDKDAATDFANPFSKQIFSLPNSGKLNFESTAGDKDAATDFANPFSKQIFSLPNSGKLNFESTAVDKDAATDFVNPLSKQAFGIFNGGKSNCGSAAGDKDAANDFGNPFCKLTSTGSDNLTMSFCDPSSVNRDHSKFFSPLSNFGKSQNESYEIGGLSNASIQNLNHQTPSNFAAVGLLNPFTSNSETVPRFEGNSFAMGVASSTPFRIGNYGSQCVGPPDLGVWSAPPATGLAQKEEGNIPGSASARESDFFTKFSVGTVPSNSQKSENQNVSGSISNFGFRSLFGTLNSIDNSSHFNSGTFAKQNIGEFARPGSVPHLRSINQNVDEAKQAESGSNLNLYQPQQGSGNQSSSPSADNMNVEGNNVSNESATTNSGKRVIRKLKRP